MAEVGWPDEIVEVGLEGSMQDCDDLYYAAIMY